MSCETSAKNKFHCGKPCFKLATVRKPNVVQRGVEGYDLIDIVHAISAWSRLDPALCVRITCVQRCTIIQFEPGDTCCKDLCYAVMHSGSFSSCPAADIPLGRHTVAVKPAPSNRLQPSFQPSKWLVTAQQLSQLGQDKSRGQSHKRKSKIKAPVL
jgi:hypothetical protein